MKTIKDDEVKKIIELYESGLSQIKIGEIVGRHRETISRVLRNNGVEITFRGKKANEIKKCVICGKEFNGNRKRCDTCNTNISRYKAKKKAVEYKGGKCEKCGWSGDLSGFDFHHVNGKEFEINASTLAKTKWEKIEKELDKCQLLCALCHRLEHSNYKKYEGM